MASSSTLGNLVGRLNFTNSISTRNSKTNNGTSNSCRPFFGTNRVALFPRGTWIVSLPDWDVGVFLLCGLKVNDNGFAERAKDYQPCSEFYKVEAVLRPWRLTPVSSALLKMGIRGVTVSEVQGFGAQGGSRERQAGTEFAGDSFLKKVKLEIVVSKDQVDAVIDTIIDKSRTGEIGDGKIFVSPVVDIIRIRTGERGLQAERMLGGRAAMQVPVDGN